MVLSERPHLELKFDSIEIGTIARLNAVFPPFLVFSFVVVFLFPEMPLCVLCNFLLALLTVQMLTSAL